MITVYHLSTSRSERIVWLMDELGLERKKRPGSTPNCVEQRRSETSLQPKPSLAPLIRGSALAAPIFSPRRHTEAQLRLP